MEAMSSSVWFIVRGRGPCGVDGVGLESGIACWASLMASLRS